MLPNFKIVAGGILIFVLLFAVTGAGVVTPQIYTRIGAMPEIGRPMMLRAIADESAQLSTALRRGDELRLQELATLVAIPESQAAAAPGRDEQATIERGADERSDAATGPIVAAIAADSASAAPPPGGPDAIAAPPPVSSAGAEPVTATTAAPDGAARPTVTFAAASISDADRAKPAASAPSHAQPTSRQGALDADLTKPGDGNRSANSDAPKRHHRIASHARKRLAAAHRVRQATPATTFNPAFNMFGPTAFQSHF